MDDVIIFAEEICKIQIAARTNTDFVKGAISHFISSTANHSKFQK
jgi:hypothetical protein